jgi:hypothetical protein
LKITTVHKNVVLDSSYLEPNVLGAQITVLDVLLIINAIIVKIVSIFKEEPATQLAQLVLLLIKIHSNA